MELTEDEEKSLNGEHGEALQTAYRILSATGEATDAEKLVPIHWAHVSGVNYNTIGDAGEEFLATLSKSADLLFKANLGRAVLSGKLSNLPDASHSNHYSSEAHARLVNMKMEEREILLNISDITQEIEEEQLILAEQYFGAPALLPKREGPKREAPRREETSSSCSNCGKPLKPTTKFCGGCGTPRS